MACLLELADTKEQRALFSAGGSTDDGAGKRGRKGGNALLAFSCNSRWFCPSCHQKNIHTCAEFLVARILAPVPHRHYVLALPKMLCAYLCVITYPDGFFRCSESGL
jgi:hypothetical protein